MSSTSDSNWRVGIDESDPLQEDLLGIVFQRSAMGRQVVTPLTKMTPVNPFVCSPEWGDDLDMDFSGAVSGLPTSSTFLGRGARASFEDEVSQSPAVDRGSEIEVAARPSGEGESPVRRPPLAEYNPWESLRQATVEELASQTSAQWIFRKWAEFRGCCSRQHRRVSRVTNPLRLVVQGAERSYGTGVSSFYDLWLWMICMNLAIFLTSFVFLILPWVMRTDTYASELWSPFATSSFYLGLLGLDEVEIGKTFFFYGGYAPGPDYALRAAFNASDPANIALNLTESPPYLDLTPFSTKLANAIPYEFRFFYPLAVIVWYIVCLGIIVCAIGVHLQVVTTIDREMKFSTGVLTIWDHSVTGKAATESLRKKVASTFREYSKIDEEVEQGQSSDWRRCCGSCFSCCCCAKDEEEAFPIEERNRMILLLVRRVVGMGLTFLLLCAAITVVVFVTEYYQDLNRHFPLTASLIIALSNFFVERFLDLFVLIEGYVAERVANIHRTIRRYIIKVSLLISLISRVLFSEPDDARCVPTYAGMMFWQLLVVDLVTTTFTTVFSSFLWFAIYRGNKEKSELNISDAVNIVLYRQVVIFVGAIVSPMIPLLGALVSVVLYLVQYFVMTTTMGFPQKPIPNAKGDPFNLFVLLVTLLLSLVPMVIFFSKAGYGCGPAQTTSLYSSLTVWELYPDGNVATFFGYVSDYLAVAFFVIGLVAIIIVYLLIQRIRMHNRRFDGFRQSVQQERKVEESYHKRKAE